MSINISSPESPSSDLYRFHKPFSILHAASPEERAEWVNIWERWPTREPFAHPGYLEAFLGDGQHAICITQSSLDSGVLLPLVLRPLSGEIWCEGTPFQDATTPYGYGGAFAWGNVASEGFWNRVDEWADRSNVVTLFARLSVFPNTILPFRGPTSSEVDNIVRSLDLDSESLWMDYEHKVRKNIKKAERSGVTIELDLDGKRLEEFHKIYISTMERCGAVGGYFFPIGFFQHLVDEIPGSLAFFHAVLDGQVISSELVLVGANHTYSFLGGTDADHFDSRPNDLLKHEVIAWSRLQGKRFFVLGGGYQPNDGIFRYKKAFAPNDGAKPFTLGRRIFDEVANRSLLERRRIFDPTWQPADGFFPAYRAPRREPTELLDM